MATARGNVPPCNRRATTAVAEEKKHLLCEGASPMVVHCGLVQYGLNAVGRLYLMAWMMRVSAFLRRRTALSIVTSNTEPSDSDPIEFEVLSFTSVKDMSPAILASASGRSRALPCNCSYRSMKNCNCQLNPRRIGPKKLTSSFAQAFNIEIKCSELPNTRQSLSSP